MAEITSIPARCIRGMRRFAKFGAVGASGVVVNAGLLFLFTERIGLDYRIASLIAIESAICSNFLLNNYWTWKDRKTTRASEVLVRFFRFNLSSGLVALVINWGLLIVLTEFAGISYHIANLFGIALGTLANFGASHFWAFGGASVPESGANG